MVQQLGHSPYPNNNIIPYIWFIYVHILAYMTVLADHRMTNMSVLPDTGVLANHNIFLQQTTPVVKNKHS
jgi:hypothetical protein